MKHYLPCMSTLIKDTTWKSRPDQTLETKNWAMIMPENILEVKWIQGKQQMSWKAWWYQIMQKNAYCWFSLSPKCVSFHHEYWWTTMEWTWQFILVLVLHVTFKNQFQWNIIVGIYLTIHMKYNFCYYYFALADNEL